MMWAMTTGRLFAFCLALLMVCGRLSSAQGDTLAFKAMVAGELAPEIVSGSETEKLMNGDFEIWPYRPWDRSLPLGDGINEITM